MGQFIESCYGRRQEERIKLDIKAGIWNYERHMQQYGLFLYNPESEFFYRDIWRYRREVERKKKGLLGDGKEEGKGKVDESSGTANETVNDSPEGSESSSLLPSEVTLGTPIVRHLHGRYFWSTEDRIKRGWPAAPPETPKYTALGKILTLLEERGIE
jgi:hypothetical protein